MRHEWGTTRSTDVESIPQPPDGEGWRMRGAISAKICTGYSDSGYALHEDGVVWYWEREVDS